MHFNVLFLQTFSFKFICSKNFLVLQRFVWFFVKCLDIQWFLVYQKCRKNRTHILKKEKKSLYCFILMWNLDHRITSILSIRNLHFCVSSKQMKGWNFPFLEGDMFETWNNSVRILLYQREICFQTFLLKR